MATVLLILLILQLADGWTTYRILSEGGREKNPVVRWLMNRIGMLHGILTSKTLAIIWVVWNNWRHT